MKMLSKVSIMVMTGVFSLSLTGLVNAATTINLGNADSFVILAGSTISNTGSSVINGDLGLSPGTSVTGFPPGVVNGASHVNDSLATQAKTDLVTAYNNAVGQTPTTTVPTELGGTTKIAGIYSAVSGTFGITGTLTLDGQNDPSSVFIFKTTSTLTTAGASTIVLINGAQACNVFWQVGSSATLGTSSTFKGNILALTSITLTTSANVEGRVLARDAAVTLDTNVITRPVCTIPTTTTVTPTTTAQSRTTTSSSTPRLPNAGIAPMQSLYSLDYHSISKTLYCFDFVQCN